MKNTINIFSLFLITILFHSCRKVKINDERDFVKMKGKVTNYYSGNPIKNVSISIYNLDLNGTYDEIVAICKSNDSGRFEATMDRKKLKGTYFEFFATAPGYTGNVCGNNALWANRAVLDTIKIIQPINLKMCN
jgi:5-hydroxyisourate hydrolase-like protein (transthyretin family)